MEMNNYIIFDNGGATPDRFTIVNSETGDVFGASENPTGLNESGEWIGNCAAHRIVLNGCGWRQRQPSKKVIKAETENYINNARLDPGWIGREVDFKTLPESVKEFISRNNTGVSYAIRSPRVAMDPSSTLMRSA